MKNEFCYAEYIWLDGCQPTQQVRSKTRIIPQGETGISLQDFPEWGFDGSSTYQAEGCSSDLVLRPVSYIKDTLRGDNAFLVMCEVFEADAKTPHPSNKRAELRRLLEKGGDQHDIWVGFEQEYTFFKDNAPLGWPKDGYPAPQGPFYCSVGAKVAYGRDIVDAHMMACTEMNLMIYGINAEVMPGQWEFQIGYRGKKGESADPLTVSDHLWLARYLIHRIAEEKQVTVSFDNKPVKGDWNGAGMHTNFSTRATRDPKTGMGAIKAAIANLEKAHDAHIAVYGANLAERLTGHHETCDINTFRSGVSNRGASIRIPLNVSLEGYGYFEDRRPGANANPYEVASKLIQTVCQL